MFKNLMKVLWLFLLKILSEIVPKTNLIVFTGQSGIHYSHNTKSVFEYLQKETPDLQFVWATNHKSVYNKVSNLYGADSLVYIFSLKGVFALLRAKAICLSHGFGDISNIRLSSKTKVVQLWHGIPLKNIGVLDRSFDSNQKKKYAANSQCYDMVISCSKTEQMNLAKCFSIDENLVKVTGLPRNDTLLREKEASLLKRYPFLNSKIILHAPTFRDSGKPVDYFPFEDLELDRIHHFLEINNAYLLLRGHINEVVIGEESETYNSRIISANQDKFEDVMELLKYVDVLITDYSSIYIDFLLLDRPIIFLPYDIDEYQQYRGFLYDYAAVTPGPKPKTLDSFLEEMDNALKGDLAVNYNEVKNQFHFYQDDNSSKRVFDAIIKLINE
ncbi:MAG: hypothetical protein CMP66_00560 [Flavobacteriales bacterium]|nr:hypothetical protein [Flavobacteriales bacterium]|tara:strand:+ start:5323 stop:6480 length:1158 start_codon:yes stop_codon:yes gene_type:complete